MEERPEERQAAWELYLALLDLATVSPLDRFPPLGTGRSATWMTPSRS